MTDFGEQLNRRVELSNAEEVEDDTNLLTPFIEGVIEGSVVCFWVLVITALFMKIFRHKELGWVDIVK